jgi:WD40 repeat protein
VICGSEATGEEAAIYIWKRDSGELLSRIPGSGLVGHTNIISQVDGNQQEPYMFISCSDDETVKIWGVKDRIKIEVNSQSLQNNSKDGVKKIDVRNEKRESPNIS